MGMSPTLPCVSNLPSVALLPVCTMKHSKGKPSPLLRTVALLARGVVLLCAGIRRKVYLVPAHAGYTMTWIHLITNGYFLALTDGFLHPTPRARGPPYRGPPTPSPEQQLATEFHYWGTSSFLEQSQRLDLIRRNPARAMYDAWVIGRPGWMDAAPDVIQAIAERERDPCYRMVIIGYDADAVHDGSPSYCDEATWLRDEGMVRRRLHADGKSVRRAAKSLLEQMHDHVRETGESPTPILLRLNVPVSYAGGYSGGMPGLTRAARIAPRIESSSS